MVINIVKEKDLYNIIYRERNGNEYNTKSIKAEFIFICCPPRFVKDWDIANNFQPLIHSVKTLPLHHIYAHSTELNDLYNNKFYIKTNSILSQIISGDFNNNWFQVSYSSGRSAEFWNRIKLSKPNLFKKKILEALREININLKLDKLESHYWNNAIHYWIPNYQFDINNLSNKSIYPNPVNLPKIFYAGEAFSTEQGWMEGALQTSIKALKIYQQFSKNKIIFKPLKNIENFEYVIFENRVLDVKTWKEVHPGSTGAIKNHMKEEIDFLFKQIQHPDYAYAIMYPLQKYWFNENKIGTFVIIY